MGGEAIQVATDFGDVATKLRERIKSAFADLIPEERWDAMLKAEVDKFMVDQPHYQNDGYGRRTEVGKKPSEFSVICQGHLKELIREELAKRFEAMDKAALQAAVATWIENNHQEILMEFVRSMFSNGVQHITQQLSWDIANKLQTFIQNHPR